MALTPRDPHYPKPPAHPYCMLKDYGKSLYIASFRASDSSPCQFLAKRQTKPRETMASYGKLTQSKYTDEIT